MRLILATSTVSALSRSELLANIGYNVDLIINPNINGNKLEKELPHILSARLARNKCLEVSKNFPEDIIIAADTVLAKGRRVISRPTSKEEAARGYNLLSGGRHKVYTSVCIARLNKIINKTVTTSLKFKNLSEEEISVLLESAEWRDGANIYSCLGVASAYITWMNGSYTNVMGLPLHEIHRMLSGLGVQQSI